MESMMIERIQWTSNEKAQMAEKVASILDDNPNLSIAKALRIAQLDLPEHRRRKIQGPTTVRWLPHELENVRRIRLHEPVVTPEPAPEPITAKPEPMGLADTRSEDLLAELLVRAGRALKPVFETAVGNAINETSINQAVVMAMRSYLETIGLQNMLAPQPIKEPSIRREKVVIIGLLPDQFQVLQKEFCAAFDLRSWKNESFDKLKSLCNNAIRVYAMTDFINHTQEQAALKANRGAYRRVAGGISSLRMMLENLRHTEPCEA